MHALDCTGQSWARRCPLLEIIFGVKLLRTHVGPHQNVKHGTVLLLGLDDICFGRHDHVTVLFHFIVDLLHVTVDPARQVLLYCVEERAIVSVRAVVPPVVQSFVQRHEPALLQRGLAVAHKLLAIRKSRMDIQDARERGRFLGRHLVVCLGRCFGRRFLGGRRRARAGASAQLWAWSKLAAACSGLAAALSKEFRGVFGRVHAFAWKATTRGHDWCVLFLRRRKRDAEKTTGDAGFAYSPKIPHAVICLGRLDGSCATRHAGTGARIPCTWTRTVGTRCTYWASCLAQSRLAWHTRAVSWERHQRPGKFFWA